MASWPHRDAAGRRPPVSDAVRRRVDRALRRNIRRAARVTVPLLATAVVADSVHLVVRFGAEAIPATLLQGGVVMLATVAAVIGPRLWRRPEPAVLLILAVLYLVMLLKIHLLPGAAGTATAYLAVILVASALFVPWSPAWHIAWLGSAMVLAAGHLVGTGIAAGLDRAAADLVMAASVALLTSAMGYPLAYARMRRLLEQQLELRDLSRLSLRQERAVEDLNRELVRTARVDPVTGIGNRRALDEALAALSDRRLAVVLLDVDHFKAFNDRNGHLAGDAALARIGKILRATVRERDLVFRYGGEEFLVLLPDADRDGAAGLAERIRCAIQDETAADLGLTISAGVAVADRFSASSPLPLLRRADASLYQAKRSGRNQVVVDDIGVQAPLAVPG